MSAPKFDEAWFYQPIDAGKKINTGAALAAGGFLGRAIACTVGGTYRLHGFDPDDYDDIVLSPGALILGLIITKVTDVSGNPVVDGVVSVKGLAE